jgi:hypothetical protein
MNYKSIKNRWLAGLLLALIVLPPTVLTDEVDPILDYYWQRAGEVAPAYNPDAAGVSYRFTARSFRHRVGDGGRITKTDSVTQRYFVSDGSVDSVNTLRGDAGRFDNLDFSYPLIFEMDYHLNLFPNDTGGTSLPIGLTSDSVRRAQPDGMVVIDRYRFIARALYLYYPEKEDFRRFTRSYRFTLVDDFVFADSIWEVATKLGVFFPESYRLETGITDIEITRTPESQRP